MERSARLATSSVHPSGIASGTSTLTGLVRVLRLDRVVDGRAMFEMRVEAVVPGWN